MPQWFWVMTVMLYFTLSLESWANGRGSDAINHGSDDWACIAQYDLANVCNSGAVELFPPLYRVRLFFLFSWAGGCIEVAQLKGTWPISHLFTAITLKLKLEAFPQGDMSVWWCNIQKKKENVGTFTDLDQSYELIQCKSNIKKFLFVYLSSFSTICLISYSFDYKRLFFFFKHFLKFYPFLWKGKGK